MGALEITFLAVSKHVHWTGMLDIILVMEQQRVCAISIMIASQQHFVG